MPQIFVDGQEYTIAKPLGDATVGELLTELMASLASSRRIICQVNLDGLSLTEDSLQYAAQQDSASVQTLILKTMTYGKLTQFGLERAALLVPEVIRQVQLSAEHFRLKPQEEANRTYVTCLDDLQLLAEMIDQLSKLQDGVASHTPHSGQDVVRNNLYTLAAVTGELLTAYRRADVMVIADILTYELIPTLEEVHRSLQALRMHIRTNQNA
jgi:hypothetical protein